MLDSLVLVSAGPARAQYTAVTTPFHTVNDSFFGYQPTIFTIDITQTPARITDALVVTRAGHPAQKLDEHAVDRLVVERDRLVDQFTKLVVRTVQSSHPTLL